jgi:hypothetical protein
MRNVFVQLYFGWTLDETKTSLSSQSGAETCSDLPLLLFHGTCRASGLYIRHIPRPGQHMLMHLWSQATVDVHHAALSSLLRQLRLRPPPRVSIPSFRGVTSFTSTSTVPNDWPTPTP